MSRMFKSVVKTFNPAVGCDFGCRYCWARRQAKRQKHRCKDCYNFIPHTHMDRPIPRGERIFVGSMGDLWCPGFSDEYILDTLTLLKVRPEQTFLNCSKNPARFHNLIDAIPMNCILGTTIETNRDAVVREWSRAPLPSDRYKAMAKLNHHQKFLSIEPIMDFDMPTLLDWIRDIRPELCEIGYNNYPMFKLPEPPLSKTKELIFTIRSLGITVLEKTVRKAWFESAGANI